MGRVLRVFIALCVVIALGGAAIGGALALLVPAGRELAFGTTAYSAIAPQLDRPAERSVVYDRYGNLIAVLFAEDRAPVALDEVPQHLIDAVLAIEDRNFYEHQGVDVKGTVRALFRNLESGDVEQGGSTITQQLVKNTLIDDPERDLQRKIKEAWLATRLEDELTKDEILEQYLNVIYLGEGAYGVRSASERYFKKEPKELTIAEAALLAGLIQAPEDLSPVKHPDRAASRRALVLDAMVELDMITEAQATEAKGAALPTEATTPLPRPNDYFLEELKSRLLRDERLGTTYQERYNKVFRGGLEIHSTFDPFMQVYAVRAVNEVLPEGPTAALVTVDNTNGAVRAMVGGRGFDTEKFNLTTQGIRQTGSSFKAITLAAALEAGWSPLDRVDGSSGCSIPMPDGQEPWEPGGHGSGVATIIDQTAESINCAYARIAVALGPEKIVDMARRLGIESDLQPWPSITLGTFGTSMLEMAIAYSVFAADGVLHRPIFVGKVTGPDGEVIIEEDVLGEPVLEPNIARTETEVLKHVITDGTATRAGIGRPAAGKTGTTDLNTDAWFVGYTPQLTTAVWMGYPEQPVPMPGVYGGTYPARIWAAFMRAAHESLEELEFPAPDESRWPPSQRIDIDGRTLRPVDVTPNTSTTVPTETTIPRVTIPRPPRTSPPVTGATTTVPPTAPPTTTPPTVPPTTGPGP